MVFGFNCLEKEEKWKEGGGRVKSKQDNAILNLYFIIKQSRVYGGWRPE